jgi:hypothetical protein
MIFISTIRVVLPCPCDFYRTCPAGFDAILVRVVWVLGMKGFLCGLSFSAEWVKVMLKLLI